MTDHVNNATGVYTFTSTGPLCSIRTTLTCDDGSGSFEMLKHLTLRFNETGFTDAGPEEILGGTGAYAAITRQGVTVGGTELETGIGVGTTTGVVHLR